MLRSLKSRLAENRPKLVVIAVDVQRNPLKSGTDEYVDGLLLTLEREQIPYCFAGTRVELGGCLYGKVMHHFKNKASCVGIIYYKGYEKELCDLLVEVRSLKERYFKQRESSLS